MNDEQAMPEPGDQQILSLVRDNRSALKFFIQLYDNFRSDDPQLQTKESIQAMTGILRLMAGSSSITQYGTAEWKPDPLSFISLLDQIGDTSLANFIGITDMADIPGVDIEARADAIRKPVLDAEEADSVVDQSKLVASRPKHRSLSEGGGRRHFGSPGMMGYHLYQMAIEKRRKNKVP